MKEQLREYLDSLFADAPQTMRMIELKEEIHQNLIDKYDDLRSEGKSEEEAYNIAVVSIGDVRALISAQADGPMGTMEERAKHKRRSAILIACAVGIYILSVIPPILVGDEWGVSAMFIFWAIATGLLIFNGVTRPRYIKTDDTVVENFKAWQEEKKAKNPLRGAIMGAMWLLIVCLYFAISFTTDAWYISWLIFPIGGAASLIVSGIFNLKQ